MRSYAMSAEGGFGRQPHSGSYPMCRWTLYFEKFSLSHRPNRRAAHYPKWSEATFWITLYYANMLLISYCILYIMRSVVIFTCDLLLLWF